MLHSKKKTNIIKPPKIFDRLYPRQWSIWNKIMRRANENKNFQRKYILNFISFPFYYLVISPSECLIFFKLIKLQLLRLLGQPSKLVYLLNSLEFGIYYFFSLFLILLVSNTCWGTNLQFFKRDIKKVKTGLFSRVTAENNSSLHRESSWANNKTNTDYHPWIVLNEISKILIFFNSNSFGSDGQPLKN